MVWKGANLPYCALRYIPPYAFMVWEGANLPYCALRYIPPRAFMVWEGANLPYCALRYIPPYAFMVWKGANLPYCALRYIPPTCLHGVGRGEFTLLCLKIIEFYHKTPAPDTALSNFKAHHQYVYRTRFNAHQSNHYRSQ